MTKKQKKPILLSGIQPSGNLMIGNYIGALSNWAKLQDQYDCLFVLVDLHAITLKQNPKDLQQRCYDFLSLYLACGIDPEKSTIFVQSHVAGHSELSWILNCFTYMGELNRMTQFKEKSKRHSSNVNVGLFDYPVLMAADILLYDTDLVPVGDDQRQHLELTREVAERFNNLYGDVFTIPQIYIPEVGARIMSLLDPKTKMSKSDDNPKNYIALLDSADIIRNKLKQAVTDSGKEIKFDKNKPGICNLLTIYSAITGKPLNVIEQDYVGKGYGHLKNDLAEIIIEFLEPIKKRYGACAENQQYIEKILMEGAKAARVRSEQTMKKVQDVLGFIPQRNIV